MVAMEKAWLAAKIKDLDKEMTESLGLNRSPEYIVEPRIVGVLTEILYEEGEMVLATLADERHGGADVTRNMKTILTLPLTLTALKEEKPAPDLLRVWGFTYLEKAAYEALNLKTVGRGLPPFSTPSDAVSATLLHDNLKVSARRPLNFFCYGLRREREIGRDLEITSHYEIMISLQHWGLRVNRPHIALCHDLSEVLTYCVRLSAEGDLFPYEINGVILQVNPLDLYRDHEGRTSKRIWATLSWEG